MMDESSTLYIQIDLQLHTVYCNKRYGLISRVWVCRRLSLGCVFRRRRIQHSSSRQEPTQMHQCQSHMYYTRSHKTHTADCKVVNLRIDGICLIVVSMLSCSLMAVCSSCFTCSRSSINCIAFDLCVADGGCMLSGLKREEREKEMG